MTANTRRELGRDYQSKASEASQERRVSYSVILLDIAIQLVTEAPLASL